MKEKREQYIQQNNELMQEFSFAYSSTKSNIKAIFNSHFTGSVFWDLFGWEAEMIYMIKDLTGQNKAYQNSFYVKIY